MEETKILEGEYGEDIKFKTTLEVQNTDSIHNNILYIKVEDEYCEKEYWFDLDKLAELTGAETNIRIIG